jgi:uncharacterized protein (TIGR00251 family)
MVTITQHPEGWILDVRAQPGARRNSVAGVQAGALKVAVTAPAQDGRANKAITDLVRDALGLKRSQIQLLSGMTGRQKKVLVTGLTLTDLETRIAALIEQ